MTSFYLLLSTGGYACLLHCTTDYLATQLENKQEAHVTGKDHPHNESESDEDCATGDCNCCYHHGTYVVKENAKITTHFIFSPTALAIVLFHTEGFSYIPLKITANVSWPRSTGPPFPRSSPLYISNRTLLI
ncbi:hypothetical protein [Mucilaginibacter gilvus]|uniref:Uncharacterized protein n=1 Tax=Mucilaginibacter gilvus TaxID=2305909 RepID=A0A3S4Y684_9SPHI|nr:hypothetical protein [Mucilaginibacter gilvus]RWY48352.1 hypothetical protein EPL05_19610 [Mucilaginibacter gilvus]